MPVACGGVAVVLRLETPEPVPLRASVGSTEASASRLARVGVVGPKQVVITRRNQPCRTRGNCESRESGRSYPASVRAPGMDSGPRGPSAPPDRRPCRVGRGRWSDL